MPLITLPTHRLPTAWAIMNSILCCCDIHVMLAHIIFTVTRVLNYLLKLEFHDADTDILARISVSVSVSWNASLTTLGVACVA